MRKLFWSGALLTLGAAVATYWGAQHAKRHPQSTTGRVAQAVFTAGTKYNPVYRAGRGLAADLTRADGDDEESAADQDPSLAVPEEPRPVAELPLEPVRAAPSPLPEPINLLQVPIEDKGGEGTNGKRLSDFVPEVPEVIVPSAVLLTGTDGEVESLALMPTCPDEDDEKQGPMPYSEEDRSGKCSGCGSATGKCAGSNEEQESGLLDEPPARKGDPKSAAERIRQLYQSFQVDDKKPAIQRVDTLEFRPSDAKRGEFERIPF